MAEVYRGRVAHAVLIGQMATLLSTRLRDAGVSYTLCESLPQALASAFAWAQEHRIKTILFSPGCASFGMFRDYFQRAEVFLKAVGELKEEEKIKKFS